MARKDMYLVLSAEGEKLLAPLLDMLLTKPITPSGHAGVALVCEDVDFTFPFLHLVVRSAKNPEETAKLWLPTAAVAYAADISKATAVGFRPG